MYGVESIGSPRFEVWIRRAGSRFRDRVAAAGGRPRTEVARHGKGGRAPAGGGARDRAPRGGGGPATPLGALIQGGRSGSGRWGDAHDRRGPPKGSCILRKLLYNKK